MYRFNYNNLERARCASKTRSRNVLYDV